MRGLAGYILLARLRDMAIRLMIKLVKRDRSVEVVALVNSGYETIEHKILVPSNIAKELSLYRLSLDVHSH